MVFVIPCAAMELDPNTIGEAAAYKLLIGCVVPRPIAWVSTVDGAGIRNLAPFSFFMGVCGDPPTIAFSGGPRQGSRKDTVRNAEITGEFVVNVVDDSHADAMNATSAELAADVDEFAITGLDSAPGVRVQAPRVASAPISLECRVAQVVRIGHGPHSVVFGEVVYIHVRDDLYDATTGRIDVARLHPVGRLAGHMYSRTHEVFEMKRPNPNYKG
jgi:flavin reductase (DIM6/NTAB) family NADH-FMN oxidoreductase RutF